MQRLSQEYLLSLKTKGALQSAIYDPSKSTWRRLLVYTINMSAYSGLENNTCYI